MFVSRVLLVIDGEFCASWDMISYSFGRFRNRMSPIYTVISILSFQPSVFVLMKAL